MQAAAVLGVSVMEVQVIKLEISLMSIKVGCLLSSLSFLFELEVFRALLPPSLKGVVSSAPDTTYFFIMPVIFLGHLAGCPPYLQCLVLILSFSNFLCLVHAATPIVCPFGGHCSHIYVPSQCYEVLIYCVG